MTEIEENDTSYNDNDVFLRYESRQPLSCVNLEPNEYIAQWLVSVVRNEYRRESTTDVGLARVAVFDLEADIDWFDAADAEGNDLFYTCGELLFDAKTGALREEVREYFEGWIGQVLLLDHVTLDEAERGRGLGPKVASAIFRRLGNEETLLVTYPQPDGWEGMADEVLAAARAKVESAWASIGFVHYKDGVWLKSMSLLE